MASFFLFFQIKLIFVPCWAAWQKQCFVSCVHGIYATIGSHSITYQTSNAESVRIKIVIIHLPVYWETSFDSGLIGAKAFSQLTTVVHSLHCQLTNHMFRGFTSNPERAAISVTSCLADLGLCTDCQQGGLLQLSPCWYIVPTARPAAVRTECCHPSGFLSTAVRTHNPIAPWASLVESSKAGHFPAMCSCIPLPSILPCCELSLDIWRQHSPPLRSADSAMLVIPSTGRTKLGDCAFLVASAHAWNSLPSSVRNALSLMTFFFAS